MMQITDTEEAGEIATIEYGQEMYDTQRSNEKHGSYAQAHSEPQDRSHSSYDSFIGAGI